MSEQKPPGRWRRMTDWIGITEPGKTAEGMRPGLMVLFGVVFCVLAIHWLVQASTSDSDQHRWFSLIFGVVFLGSAAGYFVFWKRAKRRPPPGNPPPGKL